VRIGIHVGVGLGYAKAIAEAKAAGADCIQIFAGNPRAFRTAKFDQSGWDEFRRLRVEHDIGPTVIHTSYLINLATANADLHAKSAALVAHDLDVAAKAGIEYVNTHLGSYLDQDRDVGFARVCKTISDVIEHAPVGPMLLLENSAGAGNLCGGTLEEIGAILKAVDSPRVGVCIDTAHAWAAGYDLSSTAGVDKFVAGIKRHIGLRLVLALHLNDTEVELGAKRDRHWHVGQGNIGAEGFRRILAVKGLAHVAAICETPKTPELDKRNVATVRRLAGVPLAKARPSARGTKPARPAEHSTPTSGRKRK
jgi:deoxyribonuclease-4